MDKLKITGANDAGTGYATLTFTPESIVENTTISVANHATQSNTAVLTLTNTKSGTDANGSAISDSSNTSTLLIEGDGITVTESSGKLSLINQGGINSINESFNSSGNLSITVLTSNNTPINPTTTVTPTIAYGESGASSAVFASGTATLSVYTQTEVDTKIANELKAINAMTFKGTVGTGGSDVSTDLPTSNVHNGDVYKASTAGDYNNGYFEGCRIGGTDGIIPSVDLVWSYIPSGDDENNSYSLRYNSSNSKIELIDANSLAVASIAPGTDLVASGTGANVTLSHNTITRTDSTGTARTSNPGNNFVFSAITSVTTSSTGHVTGVETTQFTVTDTANYVSGVAATVGQLSGSGNNTKVTVSVTDGADTHSADIKLHSDTLEFSRDTTNNITSIDLTWGAF